jgi:metallopeptidase MepB
MSTATATKTPYPPPFFSYTPSAILETADALIAASTKVWDHVATIPPEQATFANAVKPLGDDENARQAQARILYFLSTASADKGVRAAAKQADVAIKQDAILRLARADVFAAVSAVAQRADEVAGLPAEAQVYLRRLVQDFVRSGLALDRAEDRARLKQVNLRLADLQAQYTSNMNADVSGIWLTAAELDGLAPAVLERYKRDGEGRYFVNFKRPNSNAVLGDAHSAATRRRYYVAWDNRLHEKNGAVLHEILRLRRESALLLGFRNFADASEQLRMLSTERVAAFLGSVFEPMRELALAELEELAALKAAHLETLAADQKDESSTRDIFRWDSNYYKRLAKIEQADIDPNKVAEYFSFPLLLPKLLNIFSLLLGLRFVSLSPKEDGVDTWHEDVQAYAVWNDAGEGDGFLGYLYIDPYPRDGKYGHVGTICVQLVSITTLQYHLGCLLSPIY